MYLEWSEEKFRWQVKASPEPDNTHLAVHGASMQFNTAMLDGIHAQNFPSIVSVARPGSADKVAIGTGELYCRPFSN